jgi:tripartite-type tricarboxylate transporter receptor subunit TctC
MNDTGLSGGDAEAPYRRRRVLAWGASAAITAITTITTITASAGVSAQTAAYPTRPIRIIVPYSAGTGSDVIARVVGQTIGEKLHQAVVIDNRDGGGSLIGTMHAAGAPADGYTLLIVANPFTIVPSRSAKPTYDPIRDFAPIAKVAVIPLVLAASTQLPVTSVKELVAFAKANPGKLSYASSGPGTISQQEMELFKRAAGLDIAEIPYKSTAQAMTDLVGGSVTLFPVVVPLVLQHIRAGRVRALAIFDTQRTALLPEVPLVADQLNVPGYVPTPVWYGFVAPAGTPAQVVALLRARILDAMQQPDVKERLAAVGTVPIQPSNEQFIADMKNEMQKSATLAREPGTNK